MKKLLVNFLYIVSSFYIIIEILISVIFKSKFGKFEKNAKMKFRHLKIPQCISMGGFIERVRFSKAPW
jgi:hypothetical protein